MWGKGCVRACVCVCVCWALFLHHGNSDWTWERLAGGTGVLELDNEAVPGMIAAVERDKVASEFSRSVTLSRGS